MIDKRESKNGPRYRVRLYHRGQVVASRTFRRRTDALAWERQQQDRLVAGSWVDPSAGDMTVGEWIAEWWPQRPPVKPSTAARYSGLLKNYVLPRWGRQPLATVSHSEVQGWVTKIAIASSSSTARQALTLLRQAFDAALLDGRVIKNPTLKVRLPKPPRSEPSPLTHEEVWAVVAEMRHERDRVLVLVLAYGGLRWGEAMGLRVKQVSADGRTLRLVEAATEVGGQVIFGSLKDHEARTVPLPEVVAARLARLVASKGPTDMVFATRTGQPLRVRNWRRDHLTPAAVTLDRHITPHHFRDTAATLAIGAGATVMAVARLLGHENASTTLKHYAGYFSADLTAVAAQLNTAAQPLSNLSADQTPTIFLTESTNN